MHRLSAQILDGGKRQVVSR